MKRELFAGIKQFSNTGECLENLFAKLYITAGFPPWCAEDDFCSWVEMRDPDDYEIVQYFMGDRKKII